MSISFEQQIQKLLLENNDPGLIADWLIKEWVNKDLSGQEVQSLYRFLVENGFLSSFFSQIQWLLKNGRKIPFDQIIDALTFYESYLDDDIVNEILSQIEVERWDSLPGIKSPKTLEKSLGFLIQRSIQLQKSRQHKQKSFEIKTFKEKLKKAGAGKLGPDFQVLAKKFPSDPVVKELSRQFPDAIPPSLRVLNRSGMDRLKHQLDLEEKQILEEAQTQIISELLEFAKGNPDTSKDIAITLALMGAFDAAVNALEQSPHRTQLALLKLELMWLAKDYLATLTWADEVESKFLTESEDIFHTMYFRAQALNGLGQKPAAQMILADLVKVRPDFRAASQLLREWKEYES